MQVVRVLWLIKGLGPGGAEQLLLQQAQAGDRVRFSYEVVYLVPWKDQLVGPLVEADVLVHCLPARGGWDLRWVFGLWRLLRARSFDVVHVHSPLVAAFARPVIRMMRRRAAIVYTEHNDWRRHARLTRWLNRLTFRLNDRTLAVSEGVRRGIASGLADRVAVLHHGIDLDRVRADSSSRAVMREAWGAGPRDVVIGIVANYRREKNYGRLLRAAAQVCAAEPLARFVAVGQGSLEAEIEALHFELGLGDRFILLGYRPDVPAVLAGLDVFTLTSDHEGLPVALMEALAAGLPVVATDVGGIGEAVQTGTSGLLVSAGNHDGLVAAYLHVVRDAELRGRLATGARAAADNFDARASVLQLESVYAEVDTRRPR